MKKYILFALTLFSLGLIASGVEEERDPIASLDETYSGDNSASLPLARELQKVLSDDSVDELNDKALSDIEDVIFSIDGLDENSCKGELALVRLVVSDVNSDYQGQIEEKNSRINEIGRVVSSVEWKPGVLSYIGFGAPQPKEEDFIFDGVAYSSENISSLLAEKNELQQSIDDLELAVFPVDLLEKIEIILFKRVQRDVAKIEADREESARKEEGRKAQMVGINQRLYDSMVGKLGQSETTLNDVERLFRAPHVDDYKYRGEPEKYEKELCDYKERLAKRVDRASLEEEVVRWKAVLAEAQEEIGSSERANENPRAFKQEFEANQMLKKYEHVLSLFPEKTSSWFW